MSSLPTPSDHQLIRKAAEKALSAIQAGEMGDRARYGAVNWTHLRVIDVVFCIGEDGNRFWRVLVEEASPESGIAPAVYEHLTATFPDQVIDVAAEW